MNLNFKIKDFELKRFSSKPKSYKKPQNHVLTNHEVIWAILKLIKIRDQGMENAIFMLCFKICTCGVGLKIRTRFYVFQK